MLKALELIGFKSFADKTRFEFPPGITVVVGPNGSGKSNVVDAVKWVLGEQSAKSMRGKDMSDVIFKGSGQGRKPLNAAEVTVVFDNSERLLAIDAPEVHVTRRIFRSGEGEYLINREPCRLKDIKDLFRGTGVGTDAYSLIEQGKVDQMLQASPKDRRAMFEEAAGISRFKAKKIEAQRRLERVDQNLLRLRDIVEEVDRRLKTVRSQAAKASKFREYNERLQQLRTLVGWIDWRQLTDKIESLETDLTTARQESATLHAQVESSDERAQELDAAVKRCDEELRRIESRLVKNRELLATRESTMQHERTRCTDLEDETNRRRQQYVALSGRAGNLEGRLRDLTSSLQQAHQQNERVQNELADRERTLTALNSRLEELRNANEQRRTFYVDKMRQATTLSNQVSGHQSQLAAALGTVERCQRRLAEVEEIHGSIGEQFAEAKAHEQELLDQIEQRSAIIEAATNELAESRLLLTRRQEESAHLQGRLSNIRGRIAILEELEQNREGVSEGVREVLSLSREATESDVAPSPDEEFLARSQPSTASFADVRGLVADVIQTSAEMAPLVDVALGEAAQYVILSGDRLLDDLESGAYRPCGRVGFISQEVEHARRRADVDLSRAENVIGRADRVVETADEYRPLIARLLSRTWLVETLADAFALGNIKGRGLRFVTRAGELIDSDGTLIVGPRQAALGLISRRTELRELRIELADVEERIASADAEIVRAKENIEVHNVKLRRLNDEHQQDTVALTERRAAAISFQQQFEQLEKERKTVAAELRAARALHDNTTKKLAVAKQELTETEAAVADTEAAMRAHEQQVAEVEADQRRHLEETTRAKVELAKAEQDLRGLRSQVQQLDDDRRERARAITEAHSLLAQSLQRHEQTQLTILRWEAELALQYLEKESLVSEIAAKNREREELAGQRSGLGDDTQKVRKKLRKLDEKVHKQELAASEVGQQRANLIERLREDYGIEIAECQPAELADPKQRAEIESEIAELRQRLNSIGPVNMDALAELDELEGRFNTLNGQYQDLINAKESLEKIITKINGDSRRLFVETLEAIRTNFQTLYRKAFGGGHADIVLEEGADVLEGGVDILATPPGKPQFSNSLLSGGEKALTAVSLLLAIFQFRPSPFCILDEVDAPFDEANIGRFVDVLRSFLGWTKFVIVTHSKKTMSAANTLYGVTMQESGVSKRVSVRFEDVSDDGHISADALTRDETPRAA